MTFGAFALFNPGVATAEASAVSTTSGTVSQAPPPGNEMTVTLTGSVTCTASTVQDIAVSVEQKSGATSGISDFAVSCTGAAQQWTYELSTHNTVQYKAGPATVSACALTGDPAGTCSATYGPVKMHLKRLH